MAVTGDSKIDLCELAENGTAMGPLLRDAQLLNPALKPQSVERREGTPPQGVRPTRSAWREQPCAATTTYLAAHVPEAAAR